VSNDHEAYFDQGYAVGYGKDKGAFRFYLMFVLAAVLLAAHLLNGSRIALALAIAASLVAFYFYPLIERDRARLGANQYGIFVDGLGIIAWRAISDIKLYTFAFRTIEQTEIQIALNRPLPRALVADWRRHSYLRLLMMLPWRMNERNVVRVTLEPFAAPPETIEDNLLRQWRRYSVVGAGRR